MVIYWDCHDLHHTVKKKKSLSTFGTVPSRPLLLFIYLLIYFWHQVFQDLMLASMYLTIELHPQPFSQY